MVVTRSSIIDMYQKSEQCLQIVMVGGEHGSIPAHFHKL